MQYATCNHLMRHDCRMCHSLATPDLPYDRLLIQHIYNSIVSRNTKINMEFLFALILVVELTCNFLVISL